MTWSVSDDNAGSITSSGLLTAGEVVGAFGEAIEANTTIGGLATGSSVNIKPGPLAQVVIAPDPVSVGMEITQQIVAVGADQFGNRISGIDFTWSVQEGVGVVGADGLFTAGDEPGSYDGTVQATASQGDSTVSETASVIVEPDRIAFLSDRNRVNPDIYIMDADGSNVQRVTTSEIGFQRPSWSPDGRRIAYAIENSDSGSYGNIFLINDDGTWVSTVLSESFSTFETAWSPDGTKIAYQSWEHDTEDTNNSEIYVMDVDGGNATRLTNNSDFEDHPSWSPDGSRVVFLREVDGFRHILVMDADGTNERRITSGSDDNIYPHWSPTRDEIVFQSAARGENWAVKVVDPTGLNERQLTPTAQGGFVPNWSEDGERIVFHSYRDAGDNEGLNGAEIYLMNRNGLNVTRLTDNATFDGAPAWAPRKRGVEVNEASVVIPDASTLKPLTAREVTASAGEAVVRIEVALESGSASGSGFIIDPEGLLLTNNHVISGAETITVYLSDGTSYEGTVQGRDLVRDLAVVKIEANDLPWLELGDIGQLGLGSEVLVMGYPLGLEDLSVSRGLVSAIKDDTDRNIQWIQTDSAVNPGNSGGPMLNLQAQVIGVVSAKFVGVSIEGVGFAISANTVKLYLDRLLEGEVVPP